MSVFSIWKQFFTTKLGHIAITLLFELIKISIIYGLNKTGYYIHRICWSLKSLDIVFILSSAINIEVAKTNNSFLACFEILVSIVIFIMAETTYDLAYVYFILFFIFLDYSGIDSYSQVVRWLTLLAITLTFIFELTQGLAKLTWLVILATTTITTRINNKGIV